MNNLPTISVIVPVYNVQDYLEECIGSIVSQTYKELEIILVDDGSTDRSATICDVWAKKDSRIKVIHKQNGGLSDARNAGMAIATGELIGFVDSDDMIRNDMYELLYSNMSENNSDISACGIKLFWNDGTPERMLTKSGSIVLNTEEAMLATVQESFLVQPVVYKLYKRNLIENILFEVGKYHEDVYWTYQAIANATTVSIFDESCYLYRQRNGSIMHDAYSLKRLDSLDAQFLRLKYIEEHFPAIFKKCEINIWFSCIYTYQMLIKYASIEDMTEGFKIVKKILNDYPIKLSYFKLMTLKQCIWAILAKINLSLCCRIRNALRIGF